MLVDLTHDNSGAYWEAGYAEGLGKPVIYICEQTKFDSAKTHFDTNHSTTIMWSASSPEFSTSRWWRPCVDRLISSLVMQRRVLFREKLSHITL